MIEAAVALGPNDPLGVEPDVGEASAQNISSTSFTDLLWDRTSDNLHVCCSNLSAILSQIDLIGRELAEERTALDGKGKDDMITIQASAVEMPMSAEAVMIAKRLQLNRMLMKASDAFASLEEACIALIQASNLEPEAPENTEKPPDGPGMAREWGTAAAVESALADFGTPNEKPPEPIEVTERKCQTKEFWDFIMSIGR
jgi:hypothetical protein